jgi:hypothetical protein
MYLPALDMSLSYQLIGRKNFNLGGGGFGVRGPFRLGIFVIAFAPQSYNADD